MDSGDRTRDFAHENNGLSPPTVNNPTARQPSPVPSTPSYQTSTSLRPEQQLRPTLRPQTSRPSIRISRIPSAQNLRARVQPAASATNLNDPIAQTGRRRSSSDPQRTSWPPRLDDGLTRSATRTSYMEPVQEESSRITRQEASRPEPNTPSLAGLSPPTANASSPSSMPSPNMLRRASAAVGSAIGFGARRNPPTLDTPDTPAIAPSNEYESQLVDILDVNSLFIPDLGPLFNRRPTYTLSRRPDDSQPPAVPPPVRPPTIHEVDTTSTGEKAESPDSETDGERPSMARSNTLSTITSTVSESRYAVKPENFSFEGWSAQDKAEINDHVRHQMHSRRSKFKRGWRGFKQYVRKPLGLFVTVYATLITLFGLAWVLFLIGWINVGGRRDYIINVIDNVLVALFAIIGDGLAPFRAVDTYHMAFIAHYHHLTWRLRNEKALPKLHDHNDLPSLRPSNFDIEASADPATIAAEAEEKEEMTVLTPKQQQKLQHHQDKFSKSHTFYKPHETETHHAFPLRLLVAVVVLLDCHSLLQIALGTCTWSISYHVRPFALTTVILCCSITCNITAGIVISIGDRMTRKKDVIERMFRQELTEHAIKKLEKRKEKEKLRNRELERAALPQTVHEESEPGSPSSRHRADPMERVEAAAALPMGRGDLAEASAPWSPGVSSVGQRMPIMERSRPVERTVYEGT
ncbi:MAG: hypothetical protein Q9165_006615 [Trypethelium subeluteriae]